MSVHWGNYHSQNHLGGGGGGEVGTFGGEASPGIGWTFAEHMLGIG